MTTPADGRPVDLRDDGLLWLINRTVFHPRGYALAMTEGPDGRREFTLRGDGREPWTFGDDYDEDALLARVREVMP